MKLCYVGKYKYCYIIHVYLFQIKTASRHQFVDRMAANDAQAQHIHT